MIIFLFLVSTIFLPVCPVIAQPKLAAIPPYKIGVNGSRLGNWDGPIASAGFAGSYFGPECLEPFFILPVDWSGDYYDAIPALATNWTMIPWPNEMNHHPTKPFFNTGGVKAIEFTLRDNVTFHDGSPFNATVAKWNIDRHIVITGNLTGKLDPQLLGEEMYKAMYSFWLPAEVWAQYETDSWNVSQFINKTASYGEFGASKTPPSSPLWRDYYNSTYPRIKNVTIIEPGDPYGGKIRVNYNDWSGVLLYVDFTMISMEAYKDYFDIPIVGMGDDPGYLQPNVRSGYPDPDVQFPGHLIGTGPYRYIEFDETSEQGTMWRYEDWWNSTAMQAYDLHKVPEIAIVTFKLSQSGFAKKSLALLSRTIDYATDDGNMDFDAMVADPNINYNVSGIGTDRTFITLNAINETYWKTWADAMVNVSAVSGVDLKHLYDVDDVTETVQVDGINRAMRKAVSYAFNYDLYISNVLQGRGVRSGGFLSPGNEYYNPDIPLPYRNLTIARQALLDDSYWGGICADRGLSVANLTNDQDWIDVANTNPIMEFKLLWDQNTLDRASLFGNSIKDIGLVLGGPNGAPDPLLEVSPDIYTVLFTEGAVGTVPWFTTHGLPSDWPGANYAFGPYIEYYCKSPVGTVFPKAALINTGFNYNDTVDFWIDKSWFVNRTAGQELWDNLTRHYQTFQYSDIFICHTQYGYAIDKDWVFHEPQLGTEFVEYIGPPIAEGIPIPGFQTAAILAISVVSMTGIGYSLNRKRKRAYK